jgi:hypothetical protein
MAQTTQCPTVPPEILKRILKHNSDITQTQTQQKENMT